MRECPFCGFDEGWVKEASYQKPILYKVVCKVCGASGPVSKTYEGAEDKWNGSLKNYDGEELKAELKEEAMGGVSSPMSTLNNTPGVGNAVPAGSAAMSGAQQYSQSAIGSGDTWGGKSKRKKTKKKSERYKIASFEEYSKKIKNNGLTKK